MTRISQHSRLFRPAFLAVAWLTLSGFACPIFCNEQTNIQVSYNDARDECRQYAENKLAGMATPEESGQKTKLVGLFSECMKGKGWDVPGPTQADGKPIPAKDPNAPAAGGPQQATYSRDDLQRSADCAWARQNAGSNPVAATRAEACDLECRQRLSANPYGLRPAACGPEYPEDRVRKRLVGNMAAEIPPAAGAAEAKPKAKKKPKKPAKKKTTAKKPVPKCDLSAQKVLDKALQDVDCEP